MDFTRSTSEKMNLWPVEHFFPRFFLDQYRSFFQKYFLWNSYFRLSFILIFSRFCKKNKPQKHSCKHFYNLWHSHNQSTNQYLLFDKGYKIGQNNKPYNHIRSYHSKFWVPSNCNNFHWRILHILNHLNIRTCNRSVKCYGLLFQCYI